MLFMKKTFFAAIRSGAKTTTLRYWRWPHVRAGSIVTMPGLGRVRIDTVRAVKPRYLTAADAHADGFKTLKELRETLEEIYPPESRCGRTLFQVHFTYPAP